MLRAKYWDQYAQPQAVSSTRSNTRTLRSSLQLASCSPLLPSRACLHAKRFTAATCLELFTSARIRSGPWSWWDRKSNRSNRSNRSPLIDLQELLCGYRPIRDAADRVHDDGPALGARREDQHGFVKGEIDGGDALGELEGGTASPLRRLGCGGGPYLDLKQTLSNSFNDGGG